MMIEEDKAVEIVAQWIMVTDWLISYAPEEIGEAQALIRFLMAVIRVNIQLCHSGSVLLLIIQFIILKTALKNLILTAKNSFANDVILGRFIIDSIWLLKILPAFIFQKELILTLIFSRNEDLRA